MVQDWQPWKLKGSPCPGISPRIDISKANLHHYTDSTQVTSQGTNFYSYKIHCYSDGTANKEVRFVTLTPVH